MQAKTRTDFSSAVSKTLKVLKDGESYTQNKLAQKILALLSDVQSTLHERKIYISEMENAKVIRMGERSGLASFPEKIQNLILKTVYYPTTSREEEILTHLLLTNALDEKSSIVIPKDKILSELIEAEFVTKTNKGRFHLTSDGKMIAKGALKLYPELREINDLLKNK
jgi:predicted transcriptional regulator